MRKTIVCPSCGSGTYKKNGFTHNQKQNHKCKKCGRQFVLNPEKRFINETEWRIIERLFVERLSPRGICRAVQISMTWLLQYMVRLFEQLPDDLNLCVQLNFNIDEIDVFTIDTQADEMWSFVGSKENQQWIWIAIDAVSKQIIAFHVGDRTGDGAYQLWQKIPKIYRERGRFFTDYYESYVDVIPPAQHFQVDKQSGKTAFIERFNCTIRQRNSRLVRKTLSFSKKLENHIGSIHYFICHYNSALLV